MGLLKMVLVKITIFMLIKRALVLKQYTLDCVSAGSAATLFMNPNILTAFYTTMTNSANDIQTAVNVWTAAPTKGNKGAIKVAMDATKVILKSYAFQVQTISNLPANAATRLEAATNIEQSHLTPQKVGITKKDKPVTPQISAKNTGTGTVDGKVINTHPYPAPNITFFFAISKAPVTTPATPEAVVTVVEGQLKITATYAYQFLMLSVDNKGKLVTFKTLTPGLDYRVYSYSKNGDKFTSDLSDPYDVKG